MALTYTPPGQIGSPCPPFSLKDTSNAVYDHNSLVGKKASLIMFICNHCPYVKAIEDRLIMLAQEMLSLGVAVLAISSNDTLAYPEDSLEHMRLRSEQKKYPFPYLFDADQSVAKAFDAVCTPDFFVYDENLLLSYRGRLDDSWKDAKNVTRHELRHALLQLLDNKDVPLTQYPSMGCSIKWKNTY